MTKAKDITPDHPLVERALEYIRAHDGHRITSAELSRTIGLAVGPDCTSCGVGGAILRALVESNKVTTDKKHTSSGGYRYWVVKP